jgi:hypothetical protein
MNNEQKCECCGESLSFTWSDTHGVGCCHTCGLPYTLYHYEGDKRVEKPPAVAIKPEWVSVGKAYWDEKRMRVFPGCYDMGISTGDRTYSGASAHEMNEFNAWLAAHPELYPAKTEAA